LPLLKAILLINKRLNSWLLTSPFVKFADMGTKKLRIYSPEVTPRLEYATEIIFSTILGIEYEITTDRRRIGSSPAIIYSGGVHLPGWQGGERKDILDPHSQCTIAPD